MPENYRDMIERHKDAGTCHLCGKVVPDGGEIHGLSGAHWACHKKQEALTSPEAFDALDARLKAAIEKVKGLL